MERSYGSGKTIVKSEGLLQKKAVVPYYINIRYTIIGEVEELEGYKYNAR